MRWIAVLLGTLMYLGIMRIFVRNFEQKPIFYHVIGGLVIALSIYFFPFTTWKNVFIFHLIYMLLIKYLYINKTFTAAFVGVITYVIVTVSSLLSSNFVVWFTEQYVDFRMTFNNTYPLYYVFMMITIVTMVLFILHLLRLINGSNIDFSNKIYHFAFLNFGIILLLLIVLRINLSASTYVVVIESKLVNIIMVINLLIILASVLSVLMFTNKLLLNDLKVDRLKLKAEYDYMTNAYSKEKGVATLVQQMNDSQRNGAPLTIAYADVNHLKNVNDQYGHKAGDDLIINFARIITNITKDRAFLTRMGGDEFIITFVDTAITEARSIWEKIEHAFEQFNEEGKRLYHLSASIGFVMYEPEEHSSVTTLISYADNEMYKQKRSRLRDEIY